MIRASFQKSRGGFSAVHITGHAGYGEEGSDIVCAAVTSAFQLAANGITEILLEDASVTVGENEAGILLSADAGNAAIAFLTALHLHYTLLCEQYPENIELTISEV